MYLTKLEEQLYCLQKLFMIQDAFRLEFRIKLNISEIIIYLIISIVQSNRNNVQVIEMELLAVFRLTILFKYE